MTTATKTEPIRHTPKSSNIAHIQYHPDERTMVVEFLSGGKYAFDDTPEEFAREFMAAPSAGKFFHERIRGKFSVRKLEA